MGCFVPVPGLLILASGCTHGAGINRKAEARILNSHSTLVPKSRKDKSLISNTGEEAFVVFRGVYIFLLDGFFSKIF